MEYEEEQEYLMGEEEGIFCDDESRLDMMRVGG